MYKNRYNKEEGLTMSHLTSKQNNPSNLRIALLNEVLEHGGELNHDSSNDLHNNYLLDIYGGEDFLKSKFPNIYELITAPPVEGKIADKSIDAMKNEFSIDYISFGKKNTKNVDALLNDDYGVGTCARAQFTEEKVIVYTHGELFDSRYPEDAIATICEYTENTMLSENSIWENLSHFIPPSDLVYEAIVTFSFYYYVDGKLVHDAKHTALETKKRYGGSSIVDKIQVIDPMNTKSNKQEIVVILNRKAIYSEGTYDYDYENVLSEDEKSAKVYLDFKGSVTLLDQFEVQPFDKNKPFTLALRYEGEGVAFYNNPNLKSFFTNSKNTLSWSFDKKNDGYNWHDYLSLTRFVAKQGVVEFYCKMYVPFINKNLSEPFIEYAQVVIKSGVLESTNDKTTHHIPYLKLLWGCIGKNTKIKLANGTEKNIEELKIAEKVLSNKGEALSIKNILTGTEKTMIYIETVNGKSVMLTENHTIYTQRGIILAAKVNAADSIEIMNGFERVKYCFPIDYNDTVYSIDLEGNHGIFCNGLVLGDLGSQNSLDGSVTKPEKVYPPETESFYSEFKELFKNLKQGGTQNE
jgi:hypothetical protein